MRPRNNKHKINLYYPKGEKLLGWWHLFDSLKNVDLPLKAVIAIGVSKGMHKGTGGCQYRKWSGYSQFVKAEGYYNKRSMHSLATTDKEEAKLIEAYQAEFDAEDIYMALSQGVKKRWRL